MPGPSVTVIPRQIVLVRSSFPSQILRYSATPLRCVVLQSLLFRSDPPTQEEEDIFDVIAKYVF